MASFNLTSATNLFKIKYGKLSEQTYNNSCVLMARIKKEYSFTGKRMDVAVPTSFSGGVGSGSLPTANAASYEDAQLTAKKLYSVIQLDREAIKAAENDEGSFVRLTKHAVQKGVESFNRNLERQLFGNGDGSLGVIQANATGTAAAPVIIITAASWKAANWEEKDYVNFSTDSSVFEVVAVVESTRTITLSRLSGSLDLTATGSGLTGYMQNSKDNDIEGLKGVLDATSGSKYGVTIGRRWQAFQKAAGGGGITTDLMNEVMIGVERQCGKVPNLILTSSVQFRKILNSIEDQKRYPISPRDASMKGKISFEGLEFMSAAGVVPIAWSRFCEDDRMYFLNDNYLTMHHRPGSPGWAEDDGTVFLRDAGADSYSARYVSYGQFYVPPPFHGVMTGLAV